MVLMRSLSVAECKLYADGHLTYLIAVLLFLEMTNLTTIISDGMQRNENDVVSDLRLTPWLILRHFVSLAKRCCVNSLRECQALATLYWKAIL